MVSCAIRWHKSNFRPTKSDWTHAKICITRFHVVTQQLFTPELHVYWMKSTRMFEKVPRHDIQVIDCSEFYQIVRDYVAFSELCGIMRRRQNYAIPRPRIIPWGLCTALHGTVLHCTVLHCTVLCCTAPVCCASLHCSVLYCTVLHCTVPYCIIFTVLQCTMLHYAVLWWYGILSNYVRRDLHHNGIKQIFLNIFL